MENLETRTVLVTGANGGLGRETIKLLVKNGFGKVIMACRSQSKANAARDEILAETGAKPESVITFGGYDMNNPEAIRAAISALPKDTLIDTVFLGAGGVVFEKDYQTIQWNGLTIEKTIFQNVVGGHIVLSELVHRNLLADGARVIVAGGEGARGIPGMMEIPKFSDANDLRRYVLGDFAGRKKYNPMNAIGVSKLISALWVRKVSKLMADKMEIVWFSPGLTYGTSGTSGLPPTMNWFVQKVVFGAMGLLGKAQNPQQGASKFADCIEGKIGKNGDLIASPQGKSIGDLVDQGPMNPAFDDDKLHAEFWAILEEVCGPFGEQQDAVLEYVK